MATKFELFQDKAGEYRWRLRHQNGNIIADSAEGYTSKSSAINGIESVKNNVGMASIKDSETGQVISRQAAPPATAAVPQSTPVAAASSTPAWKANNAVSSGDGMSAAAIVALIAVAWFVLGIGVILLAG
ncbi:HVO_2922 family protein [Dehalogenimonas sp. 4OHTPN]|uniref:HVO_2922 family protein n=1 Tax=Dehalogenimonas sp. 4OHTPN TaxID=3166643 RepID=A0AAU8GER0_9CHLR